MAVVLLGTPVTTYMASAEDPSPITIKYGSVPVSSVALLAGSSVSLSAVSAVEVGFTWLSNNMSIVSVNNGRLTAGGPGRATVSVTAAGGSGSGSVSVYVYSGEKIFDGVKYATLDYFDGGKAVHEAMVTGFTDSLPSVLTLPPSVTLDGSIYSVTAVKEKAFWFCDSVTSVTVPDSVRFVGASAFLDCDQLSAVALPSSLAALPEGLFSSCEALASLSLPSSVTAVGDGAFASCLNLTSVSLPLGLTAVGNGSFSSCPKLTTVTLPPTVSSVGSWAFGDCSALSKLFYKQGLEKALSTASVPAAANLLAYTVEDEHASPVKVNISEGTLGSDTTSVLLCPFAMGEGYKITSVASGVNGVSLLDDHLWYGGQVSKQPTCTEPGVMPYTCSGGCGETKTVEVAALGHDLSDVVFSAPTAEKLGRTHRACSRCSSVVASWFTLKDGASPTMYPDGTRFSDSDSTPRAAKTFDLNGQALTMILQDPLGALGAGTLDLEVHPIELPGDFDGDVDVEHAHAYEIVPAVDGVKVSGGLSNKVRLLYKIPQGWDRDDLEVFLAQAGQDMEFSETTETVGDDEYLVVWTDHFSPYVFVDKLNPEEKAALETKPNPDDPNGDSNAHQNGAIITTDSPQGDSGNGQTNGDHSVKTGDASGEILLLSTLAMIATGLYLGFYLKKKTSF